MLVVYLIWWMYGVSIRLAWGGVLLGRIVTLDCRLLHLSSASHGRGIESEMKEDEELDEQDRNLGAWTYRNSLSNRHLLMMCPNHPNPMLSHLMEPDVPPAQQPADPDFSCPESKPCSRPFRSKPTYVCGSQRRSSIRSSGLCHERFGHSLFSITECYTGQWGI